MPVIEFGNSDIDSDLWGVNDEVELALDDGGLNQKSRFLIDDETNEKVNEFLAGFVDGFELFTILQAEGVDEFYLNNGFLLFTPAEVEARIGRAAAGQPPEAGPAPPEEPKKKT